MARTKQSGRAKRKGKRNSKSAVGDANAFESENVEQSEEGQSTDLNESQTSEDLNETKVSSQLKNTETSEQLDDSTMSDQDSAAQDVEMAVENQEYQNDNVDTKKQPNFEAVETSEAAATEIQTSQQLSEMGELEELKPDLVDESEIDINKLDVENIEKQSQEDESNAKSDVSQEKLSHKDSKDKLQKNIEDETVISYKPHTFPEVNCNALTEKWEWHIRLYPVDYTDTRNCVFNSASKLAEETWFHVDKKNNGMGTYNLCIRGDNDASEVVLRIMQAPMKYRYLTLDVTRRSPSKDTIDHLKETMIENENSDLQNEMDNLPKTEIKETAVLLLDFMHIKSFDGLEGKEKKRSLFVKYLPEGTTKELLSVLFPLANNLDIKKTGKGRSIGDLNVSEVNNILGYCKSYVSININGTKNIYLDWIEDDTDDGVEIFEPVEESPLEVLPGNDEIQYEAVPVVEEDETVQYLKRKRDIEIEHRKNKQSRNDGNRIKDGRSRMKGDLNRIKLEGIRPLMEITSVEKREKRSRWDKDVGADVLKRQMVMNEKIHSQLAMLQSSSIGAIPSLLDTPIMQVTRGRKDRKRDRFERDRKNAETNRPSENPRQNNRDKNLNRRDRSGDRRNSRDGRPDHYGRGGRFDVPVRGGHFGGGNRFDDRRGRGGRFNEDRFSNMGGRFPGQNRGGPFDSFGRDVGPPNDIPSRGATYETRGGPFEPPGRMDMPGRGGHFPHAGRGNGRFDAKGRGSHFDSAGRGGHFDAPIRGHFEHPGRSGNFEPPRRGGHFEASKGNYDTSGRGGHFDSSGRGGHFDSTGRGGHYENQSRGTGRFDGPGRGAPHYDRQGRGARFDGHGRGGIQGDSRGRGKSGFDNRNKGTNFEKGNNNFGQQNTYEQQNYGGSQDYGNQQSYNYSNQQTGYNNNQSSYSSAQSGYNTQVSYNQQNPYNQGSYDTQQNAVTNNQSSDYTSQQTSQTGYTTQVAQPVSYPTQTSIYGGQQTGYDQGTWAQQAYSNQPQTSYASNTVSGNDGSYWGQSGDYTAQTSTSTAVGQQQDYSQAYGQPSTATNQAAGYNYSTQNVNTLSGGTDYTTDAAAAVAAYTNQGFYSTGQQQTVGVTDATYGTYTTQDTSVYGTTQSTLTTAYNFAQYPSNSS